MQVPTYLDRPDRRVPMSEASSPLLLQHQENKNEEKNRAIYYLSRLSALPLLQCSSPPPRKRRRWWSQTTFFLQSHLHLPLLKVIAHLIPISPIKTRQNFSDSENQSNEEEIMGSMEEYTTSRKQNHQQPSTIRSKLKLVLLLISSNLLTIYLFSSHKPLSFRLSDHVPVIHLWDSQSLLRELNSTQLRLSQTKSQLSQLHLRLHTSNSLLENLLSELGRTHNHHSITDGDLSGELKLAVGPHKLPLGFTSQLDTDELFPSLGSPCLRFLDELTQYMNYPIGGDCPVDDNFAQRLMLKGCEPLPRRRCHPKSPSGYIGPHPFPSSLWSIPPDTSIIWEPYSCKNYSCLVNRGKSKGSYDCKDCFDLHGRERTRWLYDNGGLDYSIDHVLSLRPPGTIRIGLDIGGGSGTFAARMRERNVTIVTSSMNFDGPFNSFIASRGLLALHHSVANRLPFFDHTLDIVHSMHVLSNWIPDMVLEFALYDIFRVLRPGGLFWLDHFFCVGREMNSTYVPMFERIGFQKLRWDAGRKLDRGIDKNEWYLSALLEKPMT